MSPKQINNIKPSIGLFDPLSKFRTKNLEQKSTTFFKTVN